jgi:hypothetical protein
MCYSTHQHIVDNSLLLQRAIFSLNQLGVATPAEVAKYVNAKSAQHWAVPGAGTFFRVHFAKVNGDSPYFTRRERTDCGRSRFIYELTHLGKKLALGIEL